MTLQIDGSNGKYDNLINDKSVKYAKNAVDNYHEYMQAPLLNDNNSTPPVFDFSGTPESLDKNLESMEKFVDENDNYLKSLLPLEYEYRYIPNFSNGQIDKKALFAVANEDMEGANELSVEEFEERYLIDDDSQTAKALDLNNDGKIDTREYSANILASDVLSKGTTDPMKANGTINIQGMNAILEYSKKSNVDAAKKLYTSIYNAYDLGK